MQCYSWELRDPCEENKTVQLLELISVVEQDHLSGHKLHSCNKNYTLVILIILWLTHRKAGFFLKTSILSTACSYALHSQKVLEGTQLETSTYLFSMYQLTQCYILKEPLDDDWIPTRKLYALLTWLYRIWVASTLISNRPLTGGTSITLFLNLLMSFHSLWKLII